MSFMEKREIVLFSTIVIGLSSLVCFISHKLDNSNLSILTVFTPSFLALVFTTIVKGRKGVYDLFIKQTIKKTSIKWLLLSLLGIPILASFAILTDLNFDVSRFGLRTTQLMPQMAVIVLIALGEEYGWRGFLLPKLMNHFNLLYSSIILGLIWGFWHFPAYLIGTGVPLEMNFMIFLLWVLLATLLISWIYYYTKSVFTSILAHIGANTAFNYLSILPEFTGSMTPFLILLLYLSIVVLIIYYIKRKDFIKRTKT